MIYIPIFLLREEHSPRIKKPKKKEGCLIFSSLVSTKRMNIRSHAIKNAACVMSFDRLINAIGKIGKKQKNMAHIFNGTRPTPRSFK